MKALIYKLKNTNLSKNLILKAFLIVFLLIFYCFIFINQYDIQFLRNGFNTIFASELQIYCLDVGQATSVCVILPNGQVWVLDTGSEESEKEFLNSLEQILYKNNLHKIDYLLLSHSDVDHIGGAKALLKIYQVDHVLRPKILAEGEVNPNGYKVVYNQTYKEVIEAVYEEPDCEIEFVENKSFTFDETEVRIFAGDKDYYSQTNAYSPFVTFTFKQRTFMYTGDVNSTREDELLATIEKENLKINVDFLFVAHHGSSYSTSDKFLQTIKPFYALISAADNMHPSREVITRLKAVGVKDILVTKEAGLIGIGIDSSSAFHVATMENSWDLPFIVCLITIAVLFLLTVDFFSEKLKHFRYLPRKILY